MSDLPANAKRHFDTSIGTEELGHLEMIGAIVHQLTRNLSPADVKRCGFEDYYADHKFGVSPQGASGMSFTAAGIGVKNDPIADLTENLAAEQKARATYENLITLADDPDVIDPLRFLRAREIVHFQRFGETLRVLIDDVNRRRVFSAKNN